MPFEVAISPSTLSVRGNATLLEGQSTADFNEVPAIIPPATKGPSNSIIQRDQSICVRFRWQTRGIFTAFLGGGTWKCDVLFEKMGGGEFGFNPMNAVAAVGAPNNYVLDVNIPPTTLPSGVYRVVARLRWNFASGAPGPIVAFHDLDLIEVYED